jgi:hypothetical protein
VPPHLLASATGGVSFLMQVGGAFGVNILAILLQRRTIFHGAHLSNEMNETNAEMLYAHALQAQLLEVGGMTQVQAFQSAFGVINQRVAQEALVYAFRDCFFAIFVWFVLVLGGLALMPKPKLIQPPR